MQDIKTAGIRKIEEKLETMPQDSVRAFALECAKDFKTSWISLGQALYSIWNDKLYKEWGYQQFETYSVKEIGIKKETAMKLLKSYGFLEKEEPKYLDKEHMKNQEPIKLPNYEAVNVLRMVKGKEAVVGKQEYENLKKDVFEKGRDAKDLKKDLTALIKQREEVDPEEARHKSRQMVIRRLVSALQAVKKDAEVLKVLPADIIDQTEKLIKKIEIELD
jgi:tyrosyl-tRNA synthetase